MPVVWTVFGQTQICLRMCACVCVEREDASSRRFRDGDGVYLLFLTFPEMGVVCLPEREDLEISKSSGAITILFLFFSFEEILCIVVKMFDSFHESCTKMWENPNSWYIQPKVRVKSKPSKLDNILDSICSSSQTNLRDIEAHPLKNFWKHCCRKEIILCT